MYTYIYSIVPFCLLVLVNSLLLIKSVFCNKMNQVGPMTNSAQKRHKRSMTLTLIVITFSFILFTLPSSIAGGYLYRQMISSENGLATLYLLNNISFSFHSFNFIVFLIFNKKFQNEFKKIIRKGKRTTKMTTTHST